MSENNGFVDLGSLDPIKVDYKIGGTRYQLREASEGAAAQYRNMGAKLHKYNDGKVVGFNDGLGDIEPFLVSLCLHKVEEDKPEMLWPKVPLSTIRNWPARIVRPLFDKAKEISRLDEKDTVESLEKKGLDLAERAGKLPLDQEGWNSMVTKMLGKFKETAGLEAQEGETTAKNDSATTITASS